MKIKVLYRDGNRWIGILNGKEVSFRTTPEADGKILFSPDNVVDLGDLDFEEPPQNIFRKDLTNR